MESPATPARTRRPSVWWLVLVLCLSELFYLLVLKASAINPAELSFKFLIYMGALFFLYAAGYFLALPRSAATRRQLIIIAIGAVLFRVSLLGAGLEHTSSLRETIHSVKMDVRGDSIAYRHFLLFDDDVWRYLWDGHVLAHGINPYLYAPDAPELDHLTKNKDTLWSDVRANVNHPTLATVYPPLSQGAFALSHWIAPGSVLVWKGVVSLIDLTAAFFVALLLRSLQLPVTSVILYAWNPLVITMSAGSGHIDSLVAATVAATAWFLTQESVWKAALSFALAVASKIAPLILLPFVAKRLKGNGLVLAVIFLFGVYFPFLTPAIFKNLHILVYHWRFNSAWFPGLEWLLQPISSDANFWARVLSSLIVLGILIRLTRDDKGDARSFVSSGAAAFGALLFFSPTVMPWYVLWLLPLAAAGQKLVWVFFSAVVCLSVLMMKDEWQPQLWVLVLEYGSFLAFLLWFPIREARSRHTAKEIDRQERASFAWSR